MITIDGIVKRSGIAVAVAAIVDTHSGINNVTPELLQEGINALRQGVSPKDFPEAIIACDNLAAGMSIKLPGIRTIGIVAQSEIDFPGMDPDVPCIVGIPNLLQSINHGDILIIDGCEGTIHIDPDTQTIIKYQQIEEEHACRSRLFIGSEHIPAKTQTGETVCCYAYTTNMEEIVRAIDMGADGLLVDLRNSQLDVSSFYVDALLSAAGKPVAFAVDMPPTKIIEAAKLYSTPGQVRILFDPSKFDLLSNSIESQLEEMMIDSLENPDAPAVGIGTISGYENSAKANQGSYAAIDIRNCTLSDDKVDCINGYISHWVEEKDARDAIFVIGNNTDCLGCLVKAGARCVAVTYNLVSDAKFAIRAIGLEDVEE